MAGVSYILDEYQLAELVDKVERAGNLYQLKKAIIDILKTLPTEYVN